MNDAHGRTLDLRPRCDVEPSRRGAACSVGYLSGRLRSYSVAQDLTSETFLAPVASFNPTSCRP